MTATKCVRNTIQERKKKRFFVPSFFLPMRINFSLHNMRLMYTLLLQYDKSKCVDFAGFPVYVPKWHNWWKETEIHRKKQRKIWWKIRRIIIHIRMQSKLVSRSHKRQEMNSFFSPVFFIFFFLLLSLLLVFFWLRRTWMPKANVEITQRRRGAASKYNMTWNTLHTMKCKKCLKKMQHNYVFFFRSVYVLCFGCIYLTYRLVSWSKFMIFDIVDTFEHVCPFHLHFSRAQFYVENDKCQIELCLHRFRSHCMSMCVCVQMDTNQIKLILVNAHIISFSLIPSEWKNEPKIHNKFNNSSCIWYEIHMTNAWLKTNYKSISSSWCFFFFGFHNVCISSFLEW